jgi:hypothetical protein
MTLQKFFGLGVCLALLLGLLKVIFFKFLNPDLITLNLLFWLLIAVFSIGLVRRLGVINYLEAFLACGIWLLFVLLTDFLLTSFALGLKVFLNPKIWLGDLVMLLAIVASHKKRHVEIRKEQAKKKAHGHH